MNVIIRYKMLWDFNAKRVILEWEWVQGGVEGADSGQASLKSYCLSWCLLVISGSFRQVNGNSLEEA